MRIVVVSDTHGLHNKMERPIPEGDILIHSGDSLNSGDLRELPSFLGWFFDQPHAYKIFIAGNHDRSLEFHPQVCKDMIKESPGLIYLQDSECIIDGIKFYGSPWQPEFCSWSFNLPRGERLARVWDAIPYDTNVLITHGPVYNILDKTDTNEHVGCVDLRKRVLELPNLKLHCCGHIHNGYGTKKYKGIQFVNASICTEQYRPINRSIIIDI